VPAKRRTSAVTLSVVIVNYNVREFLHHALASLRVAARGIRTEFLVVDNASDDGSVEMLRRRYPKVRVIANRTNAGFARGNNIALRQARGEFILLINPDTVVQEDTLRTMLEFMRAHPDTGLAGCRILNPDGTLQLACRRSFPTPWVAFTKISGLSSLFPSSRWFGRYNLTYLPEDEVSEVEAVSGSFMFVRRKAMAQVGLLDEQFFMYGEDLDWCYRIRQAGWKVHYVPTTQIIHYKGESTRRSSINDIRTFYDAMHLFVRKHFRHSGLMVAALRFSIGAVAMGAWLRAAVRPLRFVAVDMLAVMASLIAAEYLWRGDIFLYPSYAYPTVFLVPGAIVAVLLYFAGVYTTRRLSVTRSLTGVFIAFILIAALTAFFKAYAFSRMIMVIAGAIALLLIPGWRIAARLTRRGRDRGHPSAFGRRTLIVGTTGEARALLAKLRRRVGSDNRISDLIVAPQALSYAQVLTLTGTVHRGTAVHLVPGTMEVIVGKASVDHLDELPLVEISYNIAQFGNRLRKRVFDMTVAGLLFTLLSPIFYLRRLVSGRPVPGLITGLRRVLAGDESLVGPPRHAAAPGNGDAVPALFLGKPGLTGLVQLQRGRSLSEEEAAQVNLYYARNQSVFLDLEILMKAWLQRRTAR
jgi:GT2 family glycosyltransferase/lipopolysaccharide/colanic/teichoic acid biosynthesis glycosyltransferase